MSRLGGRKVLGVTAFVAGLGLVYHSYMKKVKAFIWVIDYS